MDQLFYWYFKTFTWVLFMWVTQRHQTRCSVSLSIKLWIEFDPHFLSLYQNTSLAQLLSHVADVEGLSNQVLQWKDVRSSCMLSDRSVWWPSTFILLDPHIIIINSIIIMSYIEFCFCNKNLRYFERMFFDFLSLLCQIINHEFVLLRC